jgi:6-phosphogluconolactonase (cycloisomerase 2 family)
MKWLRILSAFLPLLCGGILTSCGTSSQSASSSNPTPSVSSSQILYTINNGTVSTYNVDVNALTFTPVEQPVNLIPNGSLIQFVPAPDDDFLYVLWADAASQQHLSVFATDSSGVPQTPAVQTVNAPSLYQFNIHSSARFAYMMQVENSGSQYVSTLRLFQINPNDGRLREYSQAQGTYGPYNVWPASLYGFSADGTQIYLSQENSQGTFYDQRPLNAGNGTVGPGVVLYQLGNGAGTSSDTLVIGAQVMIDEHVAPGMAGYLDVFPLIPRPRHHLFRCTAAMLAACATATNVQLSPIGKYLFLTDPPTQQIHVARIHLTAMNVQDTGNSIPMTAQTPGFAFSPDGTLVYAVLASDSSLHVYSFDSSSGQLLGGNTPLPMGNSSGFALASRQ